MRNRTVPLVLIMILPLVIGILSVATPQANASFSLGTPTPNFPFTVNNFEPHVAGPMAYVFPGGGLATYNGNPTGCPPSYQSPYPNGNPPCALANQLQIQSSNYAPQGSILISTPDHKVTGDLIFALFLNNPRSVISSGYKQNYTGVTIYVPPDFDLSTLQQNVGLIQSTFGSTATTIITQASAYDPFGPGYWVVTVMGSISFLPMHNYGEFYYLRLNQVVSPSTTGRYFFKIFFWDRFNNLVYPSASFSGRAVNKNMAAEVAPSSGPTNATMPAANYPVLLAEASPDPAVITGTIRYGTYNTTLYGKPITQAGEVYAVGITSDATQRQVKAAGYFNASSGGVYVVEGLAPGVYDLYAQAAGFPSQLIGHSVNLAANQIYHIDGYVNPGPVIAGIVASRNTVGSAVWPSTPTAIHIELYSSGSYTTKTLVAWSPLNLTRAPYTSYNYKVPTQVAFPGLPNGKPTGVGPAEYWYVDRAGAFTNGGGVDTFVFRFGIFSQTGVPANLDGHVPQVFATWDNGLTAGRYWVRIYVTGYLQTLADGVTFNPSYFDIAPNEWAGSVESITTVYQSSPLTTTVRFHDQPGILINCPISGCIGNAAQGLSTGNRYLILELRDSAGNLAGMNFTYVSASANQVSIEVNGFGGFGPDQFGVKYYGLVYNGLLDYGLPAGTYTLYAYMRGYIEQTPKPQVTSVGVAAVPTLFVLDLFRGARLNSTIYSIDWEQPYVAQTWEYPNAPMRTWLFSSAGVPATYIGFPIINPSTRPEPQVQPVGFVTQINEFDGLIASDDHGPDGSVTELMSAGIGGHVTPIWFVLPNTYGTAGFLLIPQWYRLSNSLAPADAIQPDTYTLQTFTYGYVQFDKAQMFASNGGFATNRWNLVRSANVTLTLDFATAGVFTNTVFNMSMAVRVFDGSGHLVATVSTQTPGVTYYVKNQQPTYHKPTGTFLVGNAMSVVTQLTKNMIPAGTSQVQVTLSGIYNSYGDPLIAAGKLHTIGLIDGLWYGLMGSSSTYGGSYTGGWTAEVDTWNDLPSSTFFPAVEGILEGNSYHTIPGVGFGAVSTSLQWNQLGPYAQQIIAVPNAHLGGSTTVIVTLNKRGYYAGSVYVFNKDQSQLLTQSWFTVAATGNGVTFLTPTWDSHFEMYLDAGSYSASAYAWTPTGNQAYTTQTLPVNVIWGQSNSATSIQLQESATPIPEFTAIMAVMATGFVAGIYALRKTRKN